MLTRTKRFYALMAIAGLVLGFAADAAAQELQASPQLIRKISGKSEKLEITTNSSRILTLGMKIPRVQVNNPELLDVTPLSATEVQIAAKKAGVTQVNLWDDQGTVHTVDVFIYGDVRELEHALATQFPNSSIRVYRYSNALVLAGFIDRPDYVSPIVELAQDYSPKVINNISVGGVQQVLLKVKVFEVSRTKLRQLGVDFGVLGTGGATLATSTGGLLANVTNGIGALQTVTDTAGQTVQFGVSSNGNQLLGFLDALQENNLAKVLAEPNIVAVSGRPARFNAGGEVPIIIPQGFGQFSIEYRPFGTQVDFLPIVLGNGSIRLEVRPRVSDLDETNGVQVNDTVVPGFTVREVDTAVEMKAGQTFALAGLIQRSTVATNRGLPGLANLPLLGIPFRTVSEDVNEIELLIVVTPEFVDALAPHEAPNCLPGMGTMSPNDTELYRNGLIEVTNRCNECGQHGCVRVHGHEPCCPQDGCSACGGAGCADGSCSAGIGHPVGGNHAGHGFGAAPIPVQPTPLASGGNESSLIGPPTEYAAPGLDAQELPLPQVPAQPVNAPVPPSALDFGPSASNDPSLDGPSLGGPSLRAASVPATIANPHLAPRQPQFRREVSQPYQAPALIGPVGYDE